MLGRRRHWMPTAPYWLLFLFALLLLIRWHADVPGPVDTLPAPGTPVRVVRAVDGDTLLLEGGCRVRLIGVDTPESKHPDRPPEPLGAQAARYTEERVAGREITLTYDRERFDAYHRVLAFVTIDGRLLNEDLILEGYSRAVTSFPYRSDFQRRFRKAEELARQEQRGIWGLPAIRPSE